MRASGADIHGSCNGTSDVGRGTFTAAKCKRASDWLLVQVKRDSKRGLGEGRESFATRYKGKASFYQKKKKRKERLKSFYPSTIHIATDSDY